MANTYDITQKLQAIADAIENGGGGGGGGTTVIANPSGTPTDTLNTIQIASTIYDIAGGGGGTGYTETTLWSGAPTTTSITLSDSVLNYDAIYVEGKFNNEAYMVETIDKATFTSYLGNDYISFGTHGGAYYGITPASNATHLVFFGANYNGCTRVIGLKYASGGGGASSADNVSYDNTQSGITATNVQDAIDENASDISTLNSNFSEIIKYKEVSLGNITLDANNGYYPVPSQYLPSAPTGYTHLYTMISNFGTVSTKDCIGVLSIGTYVYGKAGANITNLRLRHYYIKSEMVGTIA